MKFDFHIHSKFSTDSKLEPEEIIEHAVSIGLDGIAITDHNTMDGFLAASKIKQDKLWIVAGQEISTEIGHVIALFADDFIEGRIFLDVIENIKSKNGLAVLAHPYKFPNCFLSDDVVEKVDAIEVFNYRNNLPFPFLENFKARKLADKFNIPGLASSDAHIIEDIGKALSVVTQEIDKTSNFDLKKAILDKQIEVQGKEISFLKTVERIINFK